MQAGATNFATQTYHHDNFLISTDVDKLDIDMIYAYLAQESYWSAGISRAKVARFVLYSLCFGVYDQKETGDQQIGFARAVTDYTTFAYLADVFILDAYQGRGLGKWLVASVLSHPDVQGLRRWSLRTADAHSLYTRFGFKPYDKPANQLDYRPDNHNEF